MMPLNFVVDNFIKATPDNKYVVEFTDAIALVDYDIKLVEDKTYEFTFIWIALKDLSGEAPYFAVSRLGGIENSRIVHLGTQVLLPTTDWDVGVPVREVFDVMIPEKVLPGSYPLYIGWYNSGNLYAGFTDARSRLGNEYLVGVMVVP